MLSNCIQAGGTSNKNENRIICAGIDKEMTINHFLCQEKYILCKIDTSQPALN